MHQRNASRERLRRLAEEWHQPSRAGPTLYLTPGQAVPGHLPLPAELVARARGSATGAVLLWSPTEAHLVLPPFPVEQAAQYEGWNTKPLVELLDRPRCVAVLLLRLGRYAFGIYEGERLADSKTGSRFVKGRHRKGGSSSARFARRREEQARALFDKACHLLRERVEAYPGPLAHLLLGGERGTLQAFEGRCAYLDTLRDFRLGRTLNVAEPSLKALRDLPRLLYQGQVASFTPQEVVEGHQA